MAKVSYPHPENPLAEMKARIKRATYIPKTIKTPTISKNGLGQTQGIKGMARGFQFDSMWEFAFYIWCTEIRHGTCTRNTSEFFWYTDEEGKKARFFPDFETQEFGFAEVKGFYRPNDLLKKDATDGIVTFFGPDEMKPIMKEVNKFKPDWRNEYTEVYIQAQLQRD